MNSPRQPLLHRCDRRGIHAMQLTAMIMEVLKPHLDTQAYGEVVLELQNLMWSQGVQVITEAERIAAGRPPRNHYGMTLEELAILEQRQIDAMLRPNEFMDSDVFGVPTVAQRPEDGEECPVFTFTHKGEQFEIFRRGKIRVKASPFAPEATVVFNRIEESLAEAREAIDQITGLPETALGVSNGK